MRSIFFLIFFHFFFFALAQKQAFVSEYYIYSGFPPADSLPKMKFLHSWGDSRWSAPFAPMAGDIRFAAHDSIILIAGGSYLTAWDRKNGQLLWERGFRHRKNYSNLSRSLRILKNQPWGMVSNDKNGAYVFNYYTGELIDSLPFPSDCPEARISPNGKWLAVYGGQYQLSKIKNLKTGEVRELPGTLAAIEFHPQKEEAVVSIIPSQRLDVQLAKLELNSLQLDPIKTDFNYRQTQRIAFSQDGELLALGFFEGRLEIWDYLDQAKLMDTTVDRSWIEGLEFSPNDQELLIVGSVHILLWTRKSQKLKPIPLPKDCRCNGWEDGSWDQEGKGFLLACRQWPRPVYLTKKGVGGQLKGTETFMFPPDILSFSPDGKYLAVGSHYGPNVRILKTKRPNWRQDLPPNDSILSYSQLRFSPDGNYLLALPSAYQHKAGVKPLYSFPDLKLQPQKLKKHYLDACFTPDSRAILGIHYRKNNVFDYVLELRSIHNYRGPSAAKWEKILKEEGQPFIPLLWQSHSINLAHWLNGRLSKLLPAPVVRGYDNKSALMSEHCFGGFTAKKNYYAGIGQNGHLYLYDGQTGQPKAVVPFQGRAVLHTAISPDGRYIAVVSWEGLISLYEVPKPFRD